MTRLLISFLFVMGTASVSVASQSQDLRARCANELAVSSTLSDQCLNVFIMRDIEATRLPAPDDGLDDRLRQSHVFFATGGTELDAAGVATIARMADVLEARPMRDACLMLEGHSDAVGDEASNLELSLLRAESVANAFARRLSEPDRIRLVIGRGEDAALPGTKPTSPMNRRVAVFAQKCRN